IQSPSWYMESLGSGCYAGQYLLQEGVDTLIASITDSCGYVTNGTQCRFCALSHNSKKNVKESPASRKNHIKDALRLALQDVKKYASVNLTGGNTFTPDHGALGYIEFIEAIRNVSDIPICIEMSPPDNIIYLKKLHDAGASAVMMNIEMLDSHSVMFWGKDVEETKKYLETLKKIFETISDNKYVITVLGHIFSNKVTHFELKKIEK
ncbi:MAG: radical SAM protein, partial [Lachnospiraceae bacterium]|nr:radical SAM protein [Lachnospiraceae bacterium]